jgi:hypothetical protein
MVHENYGESFSSNPPLSDNVRDIGYVVAITGVGMLGAATSVSAHPEAIPTAMLVGGGVGAAAGTLNRYLEQCGVYEGITEACSNFILEERNKRMIKAGKIDNLHDLSHLV